MADREKTIKNLESIVGLCKVKQMDCKIGFVSREMFADFARDINEGIDLLKEQDKENKALKLLVEWAEECDFGFDQFHDEYERYKDEIKDMKYIDGMIHVAKRTLEDHGAFEEGR